MRLIKAIALGGLLLLALYAVLAPGHFPGPPGFLSDPTPILAPPSPEAPAAQAATASLAGERPVSQGNGAGGSLMPPKAVQVKVAPVRRGHGDSVGELELLVKEYAQAYGVDESLVWAVMRQESGGNPWAVSPKGAMGLMQLMPGTARLMGVQDPFDAAQNLAGGIKYLKLCLARFQENLSLALAAYNAGPENVVKYQGCPPFPETQTYVAQVLANLTGPPVRIKTELGPYGASEADPSDPAPPGLQWRVPLPQCQVPAPRVKVAASQVKPGLRPRWALQMLTQTASSRK